MTLGSVTSTGGAPASGGIDPTPSEPSTDRAASGFELLLAGARSETGPVVRDDRRDRAQPGAEPEPTARRESDSRDARETGGPNARGNDATETENKPSADHRCARELARAPTAREARTGRGPRRAPRRPRGVGRGATTDNYSRGDRAGSGRRRARLAAGHRSRRASGADHRGRPRGRRALAVGLARCHAGRPDTGRAVTARAHARPDASDPTPAGPAAGNGPVPRLDHASTATTSSVTNGTANATSTPPTVDSAGPPPSDRPRPPIPLAAAASGAATFAAAPAPTVTAGTDDATATVVAVAPPPPPAEQLVSVLTPMRTTPNGSYTLRLELKPPELGRVEMRVEMRDGVLHASIHADHEGSAQLVRDALNELRDRLDAEGVQTGELTVSDGGVGSGSQGNRDASASASASSVTAIAPTDDPGAVAAIPPALPSDTTSSLDVRV